jgi:hypothetical protein
MFNVNLDTMAITMHAGDTGSFKLHAERESGAEWTSDDRMLFTVKSGTDIVMQRIYRLDDQYDLGDGTVLIEFHNDDTDDWDVGNYSTEVRFDVSPVWEGTAPTARCVNALTTDARMIEGSIVRTKIQSTLEIQGVLGKI